jgi:hypothetical protein
MEVLCDMAQQHSQLWQHRVAGVTHGLALTHGPYLIEVQCMHGMQAHRAVTSWSKGLNLEKRKFIK